MPYNKKCCIPGCCPTEGSRPVLHKFPNPMKDPERFQAWISSVGGQVRDLAKEFVYDYRRVCNAHFEQKFICRNNRLSAIAIPTLNLPKFMESESINSAKTDMTPLDSNAETSRLVSSNINTNPSYLNITSNICSALFIGIICYCCFKNGVSLFSFHPILMSLGWIFIMTTAINAITPGDIASEWMPIRLRSARHWLLQLLGGTVLLVGFIIILINKIISEKSHFQTLHAKFGLASLIIMTVTMLGGLGALYSLKLKHYLAPIYIKLLHASVGLLTFILGIISICLGLFSSWWLTVGDEILRYTSLSLVLLVMLFTILRPTLKIYFRLKERLDNSN